MKSLFFEEKNVEIVDIQEKENKPKRREKKANKRQTKVENNKHNFKSHIYILWYTHDQDTHVYLLIVI